MHFITTNLKWNNMHLKLNPSHNWHQWWEYWDVAQQLETVTCRDMCCGRAARTKRNIVLFPPSSFRLPGMAPQPFFQSPLSFSVLISQIKLTPHLAHQQIWLHRLTNYRKNTSGMCHRRRATQHMRPQRAQISLETPCPLFFWLTEGG